MRNSSAAFNIGTRDSNLALIQARRTVAELSARLPASRVELVTFGSPGDRDRHTDLRESPPDFFTRDLDEAVLGGAIDAAVHSAKDVPYPVRSGLDWVWLPWSEDPRDAWVLRPGESLQDLPRDFRLGVSSERRSAYASRVVPDARQLPVRGNIEGRLRQLDSGGYDALLMAACALDRLGMTDRVSERIPLEAMPVPAGQGTLCMTFREDDDALLALRQLFVPAVTFAGAGVGGASHVTAAVEQSLRHADVCCHDSLLDNTLLRLLPPGAQAIHVGKRAGRHSAAQGRINDILLDAARQGRRVVRLKGGDPAIFGRLAEELQAFKRAELPYRICPGLSALNMLSAGSGILVTRRGTNHGLCVLTPREAGGGLADISAAARARFPVVAYMAVRTCGTVCGQLLEDGWDATTPAAMVFGAGTADEVTVRAALGTLPEAVDGTGTTLPGLLVVGQPAGTVYTPPGALSGRRVLLTCSNALMAKSALAVADRAGVPVCIPLVRMRPTDGGTAAAQQLGEHDWLVVTSPTAARLFLDVVRARGTDIRTIPHIAVTGPGTAAVFRQTGLHPALCPESNYSAEGLARALCAHLMSPSRVLRLRSDRAGSSLADSLRAEGHQVTDCVSYRTEAGTDAPLPRYDAVFFASASAVSGFVDSWGTEALHGVPVVCMGAPTARALSRHGIDDALQPAEATVNAAIDALAAHCLLPRLGSRRYTVTTEGGGPQEETQ